MGVGRGRLKPQQLCGYGLMGAGGLMVLLSLPLHFWAAALGGFLCYLGYTVHCQR